MRIGFPYSVDHEGEIIVLRVQGRSFRLKIEAAEPIAAWHLHFAEALYDEITRAKGIEPRSGDPI